MNVERYKRQMSLPDFGIAQQKALGDAHVVMVGAGGLGATALPYLAAAGIGKITIIDGDTVELSNLHRQTIYREANIGQLKAESAATYLKALNPECTAHPLPYRLNPSLTPKDYILHNSKPGSQGTENLTEEGVFEDASLLLDGTDNFESKSLLNAVSIAQGIPYITGSVFRHQASVGFFFGAGGETPCYHCLFPDLPQEAMNCSEAGLLGPAAGMTGLLMAQMSLQALAWPGEKIWPGDVVNLDLETYRMTKLRQPKLDECPHCQDGTETYGETDMRPQDIPLINPKDLEGKDYVLVDVRTDEEVEASPLDGALHIELQTLPSRLDELPRDKRLAFACAANVRSRMAAELAAEMGYEDVCVYDVLAA